MGKKKQNVSARPRGTELPPATQDRLHVRAVLPGGYVLADDGTLAAALEVSPVDLALAGDAEIKTRHEQFAAFIAGLQYQTPIQVVVATVPQRCERYRERVRERIDRFQALAARSRREGDEEGYRRRAHMAEVAEEHLSLFELMLEEVKPRVEQYLVVVWHNPFPLAGQRRQLSGEKLEDGKQEVDRRLAQVAAQLEHIGLETRRMDADDLVQVFYSFYHMTTSPLARATRPAILAGAVAFASTDNDQGGA